MSNFDLKPEQRQAIFEHDGADLIVSASAGSGKTFVMIERLIRLILDKKLSVNELLAVTFTEKAALEMKEKLSSALIDSINNGNKDLKEELLDLSMADICTIDAFCSRLVKRYFYQLDIGRDFEIISDFDAYRLRTEALKLTFDKYYALKLPEFLRIVDRFSKYRKDAGLREYIVKIYQIANSEADPDAWLDKTLFYYTEQGLNKLEDDYLNTVKSKIKLQVSRAIKLKDKVTCEGIYPYVTYLDAIISELNDLLLCKNLYELADVQLEFGGKLPTVKTAKELEDFKKSFQNERNKIKASVQKILDTIGKKEQERMRFLSTKDDYLIISALVKDYATNYFNLKKEENKFDFDDIERFALQLLQNEEVGNAVRDKYKNIFIDEYQDVNGVQEEIFSLLSRNNEFMVGDVKQSIYGFRGCNPDLFDSKQKSFDTKGRAIKLNYNFRSAPVILDRVNDIFDGIILKDNFGIDYKTEARLISGGKYPDNTGRVLYHKIVKPVVEKDEFSPEVYDIVKDAERKEFKVDDFATLEVVNIIKDEIGKEFYDIKSKKYKKVEYSDITILCRSKTGNTIPLVKGLEKNGIRVVSEVESSILDYKEVKLLHDFLKIVDCFYQDAPLAVCLLSRIGGLTPDELSLIRTNGVKLLENKFKHNERINFFACYDAVKNTDTDLGKKLKDFDLYLKKIRRMADFKGARYVLDTVIKDKNLSAYTLIDKLGDIREKRVERFLSEAYSNGKELSVREFLYKIENSPESFTMTETSGGNAVTIMTMHKSKGLEAPVIIIVGLEKGFNYKDTEGKIIIERDYGIALKSFDDDNRLEQPNIFYLQLKEYIKNKTRQDEMRLFYVATTRAKYSMHLVGLVDDLEPFMSVSPIDGERFGDFIPDGFPTVVVCPDGKKAQLLNETNSVIVGHRDEQLIDLIKRNLLFKYPYTEDVTLKLKTSVTANLNGEDFTVKNLPPDDDSKIFTPSKGVVTTDEGIIAHKVLENFDFSNVKDAKTELNRLVDNGLISQEELSKIDLDRLFTTLNLNVFNEISGYKLYKEQYFVTQIPANQVFDDVTTTEYVLMQGVIDLLAINGDKAIIIDYKYSGKSKENLLKTYAKQLKLYKYAVENSLKIKVEKAYIVSLLSSEEVLVEL